MKQQEPLHKELRKWIQNVIRQRNYLIKNDLSKKNTYRMFANIEHLQKRLDYFPYNTDRKISMLFQQNKEIIRSLGKNLRVLRKDWNNSTTTIQKPKM